MIEFIKNVSALVKIVPAGVLSVSLKRDMNEIHLAEDFFRAICKNPEVEYHSDAYSRLYFKCSGIKVLCLTARRGLDLCEKRDLYESLRAEFEGENEKE